MSKTPKGSLTVVGTGISIAGQMTLYTESVIKHADIVLAVVTDSTLYNLQSLNPNTYSMRTYYDKALPRSLTYQKMKQKMIDEVLAGKRVVAAFYGHPGVFVNPSHHAISELHQMGYNAAMLPGISAEDCLIADLGIDPAAYGCQSYEATQFLFRNYRIDPHMMQIIWQIGCIADFGFTHGKSEHPGLLVLQEVLLKYYPAHHEIIIYEAATMPLMQPRIEKSPLAELANLIPTGISTLVIPGLGLPDFNVDIMAKFGLTPDSFLAQLSTKNV